MYSWLVIYNNLFAIISKLHFALSIENVFYFLSYKWNSQNFWEYCILFLSYSMIIIFILFFPVIITFKLIYFFFHYSQTNEIQTQGKKKKKVHAIILITFSLSQVLAFISLQKQYSFSLHNFLELCFSPKKKKLELWKCMLIKCYNLTWKCSYWFTKIK